MIQLSCVVILDMRLWFGFYSQDQNFWLLVKYGGKWKCTKMIGTMHYPLFVPDLLSALQRLS